MKAKTFLYSFRFVFGTMPSSSPTSGGDLAAKQNVSRTCYPANPGSPPVRAMPPAASSAATCPWHRPPPRSPRRTPCAISSGAARAINHHRLGHHFGDILGNPLSSRRRSRHQLRFRSESPQNTRGCLKFAPMIGSPPRPHNCWCRSAIISALSPRRSACPSRHRPFPAK